MTISEKSQLGLRFMADRDVKIKVAQAIQKHHENRIIELKDKINIAQDLLDKVKEGNDFLIPEGLINDDVKALDLGSIDRMFSFGEAAKKYPVKYFLIQQTVWKAAELIRIGENYTGRTLKDIKQGDYMYLIGKHEFIKFLVVPDGIKGLYYDEIKDIVFEWGIKMATGESFHYKGFNKEFSRIMQLLTFVELGDIEVTLINSLQHNKAPNKNDKIYNGTRNNVYVVDSTWNKLLIRTEGFAVRGHFKLQPCGPGLADRKLIWINAYEKDGYTRRPKAEIIK